MKNLVVVKSHDINNQSVPIEFQTINFKSGEQEEKRTLSRSYVFQNFEAQMPLKMAQVLLKEQPKQFWVDRAVDKNPDEEVTEYLVKQKEIQDGFICPHCKKETKNKAGLQAHIRTHEKKK